MTQHMLINVANLRVLADGHCSERILDNPINIFARNYLHPVELVGDHFVAKIDGNNDAIVNAVSGQLIVHAPRERIWTDTSLAVFAVENGKVYVFVSGDAAWRLLPNLDAADGKSRRLSSVRFGVMMIALRGSHQCRVVHFDK